LYITGLIINIENVLTGFTQEEAALQGQRTGFS